MSSKKGDTASIRNAACGAWWCRSCREETCRFGGCGEEGGSVQHEVAFEVCITLAPWKLYDGIEKGSV